MIIIMRKYLKYNNISTTTFSPRKLYFALAIIGDQERIRWGNILTQQVAYWHLIVLLVVKLSIYHFAVSLWYFIFHFRNCGVENRLRLASRTRYNSVSVVSTSLYMCFPNTLLARLRSILTLCSHCFWSPGCHFFTLLYRMWLSLHLVSLFQFYP